MTGSPQGYLSSGRAEVSNAHPRWYVSAPDGTDLRALLAALEARGVVPYVLSDVARFGADALQSLREAILAADGALVVLTEASQSLNCIFEAGIAAALGKRVVLVVPPGMAVPSSLASFLIVRASPRDVDAIGYALDQAEGRNTTSNVQSPVVGKALGARVDELLERASLLVGVSSKSAGQAAVDLLVEAIESSGAIAVREPGGDRLFDVGVWSDDLDVIAANPLLIDVRAWLRADTVRAVLGELYVNPQAHVGLIVYLDVGKTSRAALDLARFPVLAISLLDLLGMMRTESFAEVIRRLRNQSVHGVPLR